MAMARLSAGLYLASLLVAVSASAIGGVSSTVLVSTAAALSALSPLLLTRRMAFLAHSQSHLALFAAAIAMFAAPLFSLGHVALMAVILAVSNMAVVAMSRAGFREDVATGVLVSVTAALTVVAVAAQVGGHEGHADEHALAELILGAYSVEDPTIAATSMAISALTVSVAVLMGPRLLYSAADPEYMESIGVNVAALGSLLAVLLATSMASAVLVLGALIPGALVILPGAASLRIAERMGEVIPASLLIGVASASAAHILSVATGVPAPLTLILTMLLPYLAEAAPWRSRR